MALKSHIGLNDFEKTERKTAKSFKKTMRKAVGEILSIAEDGCIRPMHGGQWIKIVIK